jgi:hypothetical protein
MNDNSRRGFFRLLLRNVIVLADEAKGRRNIPLNKLDKLPTQTVQSIVPIAFPKGWRLEGTTLYLIDRKTGEYLPYHELTSVEFYIFQEFFTGETLGQIANKAEEYNKMTTGAAWPITAHLFFELAKQRICHPKEEYELDEDLS